MTRSFSLLDEGWIPARLQNGHAQYMGLLELFERCSDIAALAETSPAGSIALYRLLLAIVHRSLTCQPGHWTDSDRAQWYGEGLPKHAVVDYLEHWRERFWLFHPEHPFMQVPALAQAEETRKGRKPWTQISLPSATGNTPAVFDHAQDASPPAIQPGLALRRLLGFLQFTPGGLVKVLRESDRAGPLGNTAAVLPLGRSLDQTLCLALHLPSSRATDDRPSWEVSPPHIADLTGPSVMATGPNDRYTRLSRAALFEPEDDGSIRHLRFAAGVALGEDPNAPDPMASYRAEKDSLVRVTFSEGRAFWRDLPALLPDPGGKASQPAAVLGYAANLHAAISFTRKEQSLLVAGVTSKKAKLVRWRSEQVTLPVALLQDAERAALLRDLIAESEGLFREFRRLARRMIAETMPDPDNKDTHSRTREIFDKGPCPATYFSHAERALGAVMERISDDRHEEAEDLWRAALVGAAHDAWSLLTTSLGRSGRIWRAEARQWARFQGLVRKWEPQPSDPQAAAVTEDGAS